MCIPLAGLGNWYTTGVDVGPVLPNDLRASPKHQFSANWKWNVWSKWHVWNVCVQLCALLPAIISSLWKVHLKHKHLYIYRYCIITGKSLLLPAPTSTTCPNIPKTLCFVWQNAHVHDHGFHLATHSLATCALNVTTPSPSPSPSPPSSSSFSSSSSSSSSWRFPWIYKA